MDFNNYAIVDSGRIYPENYPCFPYFDRRIRPISVTLKTVDKEITQIEKGVQLYFFLIENGETPENLYLVYCNNGNTYLIQNYQLIWVKNIQNVDSVQGNPILIFNEKFVWYPLMERDDSGKDYILERIVELYGINTIVPELNDFEKQLLDRLKQVTQIGSTSQLNYATLFAVRNSAKLSNYLTNSTKEQFDKYPNPRIMIKRANLLSPISSYLAAISETYEGLEKLSFIIDNYLQYFRTLFNSTWPSLAM